jgi:hypothetical protein
LNDTEQKSAATDQVAQPGEDGPPGRTKEPQQKKPKRSLTRGTREHLLTMYGLGRTLVEEPRSFPRQLKLHLLKWARATWNARGGGFYACGFVVTFLFLEVKLLVTELFTSPGAADFLIEQAFQLILRFTVDSLVNTLLALIWPAMILSVSPVNGLLFLGVGYLVFLRFLKKPLTRVLFRDD